MLFLISLGIAVCFAIFCGGTLRKHPAPFYIAAAVLSIGAVCLVNLHPAGIPAWLNDYVFAQLTKGTLAAACWAVVMWTGALPNSSPLMKKLMPQRGQLSIFSAILTLGHAVGYGISFFPRWLKHADAANLTVCILLMVIMLPLTVLSVQKIRRKMKATKWKAIQRFAYLFYALIPAHVLLLNFRKAKAGRDGAFFSLLVYGAVFIGYAVCRLRKWYLTAKKPEKHFALNLTAVAAFAVIFTGLGFAAHTTKAPETRQTMAAEVSEESQQDASPAETTDAAETESTQTDAAESAKKATEKTTVSGEDSESDETTTTAVTDESQAAEESSAEASSAESAEKSEQPAETPDTPETPNTPEAPAAPEEAAPQRIYQDGTFTGTAFGYDGDITVQVTIQDDRITDITGSTAESDELYFIDAKNIVFPAILNTQSTEVDACSGATCSSNAIMAAVRAALDSARL